MFLRRPACSMTAAARSEATGPTLQPAKRVDAILKCSHAGITQG
jgi:hypothetical protein